MNRAELINIVAQRTGFTEYTCDRIVRAAIEEMTSTLRRGESVTLYGFGRFDVKTRAPRLVRDLQSGSMHGIGYRHKVTFTASEKLINRKT